MAQERLIYMQDLLFKYQSKINKSFEKNFIEVLVENKMKDQNKYFGRNKYLSSVIFEDYKHNVGKIINVKIEKSNKKKLYLEKLINQKYESGII